MHAELWQPNSRYTLPSMPCFHLEMQRTSLATVVCIWTSAARMSTLCPMTLVPYHCILVYLIVCFFPMRCHARPLSLCLSSEWVLCLEHTLMFPTFIIIKNTLSSCLHSNSIVVLQIFLFFKNIQMFCIYSYSGTSPHLINRLLLVIVRETRKASDSSVLLTNQKRELGTR